MRKIIDLLIKNIHSLTFSFLLLFSFFQIIDKNYYQNSKFNFFSNSIINSIKENKQIFSEYFELREINEKLIIENTFLKNLKSISPDDNESFFKDLYFIDLEWIKRNKISKIENIIDKIFKDAY